jgi:hypothetical protein
VVGCCAHVAAVVWYLAHGRYIEHVHYPAENLHRNIMDASAHEYEYEIVLHSSDEN